MSAWAMGPLLGPCIGPLAGGYLIEAAGWRWVYWLVVIMVRISGIFHDTNGDRLEQGGFFIPASFIFIRESYAPVLLERKANRLRKTTGNAILRVGEEKGDSIANKFKLATIRPLRLLFLTPTVSLMAFYVAVGYGILYLLIATFSFVYRDTYGFDEGEAGLTFLPAGIGMMIGVVTFGALSDIIVTNRKKQGLEHKPKIRLSPKLTIPCGAIMPIGLFVYGWTAQYEIHYIVPMLGVVLFCCGLMGVMVQALLSSTSLRNSLIRYPDVCSKLPSRHLSTTRSVCDCSTSSAPLSRCCFSTLGRPRHVRCSRTWLGQ